MTEIESKVYNEVYERIDKHGCFHRDKDEQTTTTYSNVAWKFYHAGSMAPGAVKRAVISLVSAGRLVSVRKFHVTDDFGNPMFYADGNPVVDMVLTLPEPELAKIRHSQERKGVKKGN